MKFYFKFDFIHRKFNPYQILDLEASYHMYIEYRNIGFENIFQSWYRLF